MKLLELKAQCERLIADGHGDLPVMVWGLEDFCEATAIYAEHEVNAFGDPTGRYYVRVD